jgi:hypothetical protein
MGDAAVDSPARAHKRIVDNAPSPRPNGGVADSLDEAKAAFRAAGERKASREPRTRVLKVPELAPVWRACEQVTICDEAYNAIVKILILTGQDYWRRPDQASPGPNQNL